MLDGTHKQGTHRCVHIYMEGTCTTLRTTKPKIKPSSSFPTLCDTSIGGKSIEKSLASSANSLRLFDPWEALAREGRHPRGKRPGEKWVAEGGDVSFSRAHFRPQRASPPNRGITDSAPRLEGPGSSFCPFHWGHADFRTFREFAAWGHPKGGSVPSKSTMEPICLGEVVMSLVASACTNPKGDLSQILGWKVILWAQRAQHLSHTHTHPPTHPVPGFIKKTEGMVVGNSLEVRAWEWDAGMWEVSPATRAIQCGHRQGFLGAILSLPGQFSVKQVEPHDSGSTGGCGSPAARCRAESQTRA